MLLEAVKSGYSTGPFFICFNIILTSANNNAEKRIRNKKNVIFTESVEMPEIAA